MFFETLVCSYSLVDDKASLCETYVIFSFLRLVLAIGSKVTIVFVYLFPKEIMIQYKNVSFQIRTMFKRLK